MKLNPKGDVTIAMFFDETIRSAETARQCFSFIRRIFPEFVFEKMGRWEPLTHRYREKEAIAEWLKNRGSNSKQFGEYVYHGTKPVSFYVFVSWHQHEIYTRWTDSISLAIDEKYWTSREAVDPTQRSIEFLKELATLRSPLYGRIFHSSEFEMKFFRDRMLRDGTIGRESISLTPKEGIIDLFWTNYFGPAYVNIFGEEALNNVDCTRRERPGKGFLLSFGDNPLQWNTLDILSTQKKAKDKLDRGIFPDVSKDFLPNLKLPMKPSSIP